jgi:hypothetical protein
MVSIIVQRKGTTPQKIGDVVISELIQNEYQAKLVGIQRLVPIYFDHRIRTLSAPYTGVDDGDVVEFECYQPEVTGKHLVKKVEILCNHKQGAWTNLTIKRPEEPVND